MPYGLRNRICCTHYEHVRRNTLGHNLEANRIEVRHSRAWRQRAEEIMEHRSSAWYHVKVNLPEAFLNK